MSVSLLQLISSQPLTPAKGDSLLLVRTFEVRRHV